jgi:hypothetical protein
VKLIDFLEDSGWSKAELSRKIGVSRQGIGQWDDIPEKWVSVLEGILDSSEGAPNPVGRFEPTDEELLVIIRGRSKATDLDICQDHGWRIWEFNQMISDLVKKYPYGDKFWDDHY